MHFKNLTKSTDMEKHWQCILIVFMFKKQVLEKEVLVSMINLLFEKNNIENLLCCLAR